MPAEGQISFQSDNLGPGLWCSIGHWLIQTGGRKNRKRRHNVYREIDLNLLTCTRMTLRIALLILIYHGVGVLSLAHAEAI